MAVPSSQFSGTGTALVYSKTPGSKASSFPLFVLTFDQITVLLNMAETTGSSPEDRGEECSSDAVFCSAKKSWAEGALRCLWSRDRCYGAAVRDLGVAAQ
jgi:hypothetical protein